MSHHSIRHTRKPHAARKLHDSVFCIEPGVIAEFYLAGILIFDLFGSCDLDLDLMTFIYELDPYPLEICRMCENERPTSRLSKVIVLQAANACI